MINLSLISVAIAGCAVTTNQPMPQVALATHDQSTQWSAIPDDIVWQLDFIISSGEQSEITHEKPRLRFISEKQIFVGNDGCNSICGSVKYSTEDGSFKVDMAAQTALACEGSILKVV